MTKVTTVKNETVLEQVQELFTKLSEFIKSVKKDTDTPTSINVEVNVEDWLSWAEKNNIHPVIREFIKSYPAYLFYSIDKERKIIITPRTWERLNNMLIHNSDKTIVEIIDIIGVDILFQ
jgi:hypothetical protein